MAAAVSLYSLDQLVAGRRFALLVNRLSLAATCTAVYVSAATKDDSDGTIPPYVRGGVAALWPLSLLGADLILTRVPAVGSPAVLWTSRTGAVVIAICAFAGSAEHSISLAERVGASKATAYSAPIILDGLLIISGVVLVALATAITERKAALAAEEVHELPAVAQPVVAPAAVVVSEPTKPRPVEGSTRRKVSTSEVAAALAEDPSLTAKALADRFGVAPKTISRTEAWKSRHARNSEVAA